MGKIKWNESQRAAIEYRGKNLLLSAAAGSGKTATLTQRIIELLCSPESDAEISSMLILTFTKDAAAELKSRISSALGAAISEDPGNKRLVRQMRELDSAAISTTHSFLINELRPYFMRFDLPPDFSICEEASVEQLCRELMADTVNDFFEGSCTCPDFTLLADSVSGAKDDEALDETLLALWKDLMRLGLDADFLKREKSGEDFLKSGIGAAVCQEMKMLCRHYERLFEFYAERLAEDEATAKNSEAAMKNAEYVRGLEDALAKGYLSTKVYLSDTKLASSKSVKKDLATPEYEEYGKLKEKLSLKLKGFYEKYFAMSLADMEATDERLCRISNACAAVLAEYEKRFSAAKRERGKIDFNDVERFAARLFCNSDGSPTPEGLQVAKKYTHIFIDEYQDTNRLQDMIYTVVSHYGSRFMVGDVKQSVYCFRGSRPDNFVKYRREYEGGGNGCAIFMSENHRSDSGVIDFSNLVSDYMFPYSETPFEEPDRLVCAKEKGAGGKRCLVSLVEEGELTEADYVAERISSMVGRETLRSGERVRPGDIAIIMRTGKLSSVYKRKLEERGIPVRNGASERFFDHSEVQLLLSLLCAVDNPTVDIYLAAIMKSPIFGFSLEDLVRLRGGEKLPLWYSVCRYAREETGELALRLQAFVERLDKYREQADNMLCDKFLYYLITETGFNSLSDESGNGRLRRSVKKMYSIALNCAQSGGGLHELIVYIKGLMKGKEATDPGFDGDAVTIITTHRSKGLEYPICFICDTAKKFNTEDAKRGAIIDPENGLFTKLADPEGIVKCDTPHRNAAALAMVNGLREEEMRVLYVALTRAREQMYVTLKTKDAAASLKASSKRIAAGHSEYAVKTVDSPGDWILDAVMLNGSSPCFEFESVRADDCVGEREEAEERELCGELISRYEGELRERFSFAYSKSHLSSIPAKLPVSKLKSDILDTGYGESSARPAPAPAFLSGEKKADGAMRGTATHMLLQFCDLSRLASEAEAEGERLVKEGFITEETRALVRINEIEAFGKSSLCQSILRAKKVYREVRFNHMLNAWDYTENPGLKEKLRADQTKICVQGVVDCLFIDEKDQAILVDYKTDRLTPEMLRDKELAAAELEMRHGDQLRTYRLMCREMLGREIDRLLIYSLALGDTIELT